MSTPPTDNVKSAALRAVQQALEPLAGLLQEAGLGVGDCYAVLKRAFVASALHEGDAHRKPNVSRIAAVTGLSRAEVTRILLDTDQHREPATGTPRAARVLQGWWSDPRFVDAVGHPRKLPLLGAKPSFESLAREYSGDSSHAATLDVLLQARAVRHLPDGRLEALHRHLGQVHWSPQGLDALGERLRSHLDTLSFNLRNPSRPRYERTVQSTRVNPVYAARLIRDLTGHLDVIADSMDTELNDAEVTQSRGAAPAMRLGIGLYLFESEPADTPSEPTSSPTNKKRRTGRRRR